MWFDPFPSSDFGFISFYSSFLVLAMIPTLLCMGVIIFLLVGYYPKYLRYKEIAEGFDAINVTTSAAGMFVQQRRLLHWPSSSISLAFPVPSLTEFIVPSLSHADMIPFYSPRCSLAE